MRGTASEFLAPAVWFIRAEWRVLSSPVRGASILAFIGLVILYAIDFHRGIVITLVRVGVIGLVLYHALIWSKRPLEHPKLPKVRMRVWLAYVVFVLTLVFIGSGVVHAIVTS